MPVTKVITQIWSKVRITQAKDTVTPILSFYSLQMNDQDSTPERRVTCSPSTTAESRTGGDAVIDFANDGDVPAEKILKPKKSKQISRSAGGLKS